nr:MULTISPECIES: hypothetical protein [unclassified Microvirga]
MSEHPKDAFNHSRLITVDGAPSSLALLDHVVAEGLTGGGTPLQHATQLSALGLLPQVGEEHLCHRAEHSDMHGGHRTDIDRVQAHPMKLQLVMEAGHIRELTRQAVERLDDHDVEGSPSRLCQQVPVARAIVAGARQRSILEGRRHLEPLLGGIAAADLELVLDRGIALVLARVAGIDRGALHTRSSPAALS